MANVISQQHDKSQIRIELSEVDRSMNDLIRQAGGGWDAAEYGITREEAERRMREADTPEARGRVMADLVSRALGRADLAEFDGQIAFVGVGDTWHGLGVKVDQQMTSAEAIKLAKMDKKVEKFQTFVKIGEQEFEVPNLFAIGYEQEAAEPVLFSGVGVQDRYEIIQNETAFEFMDKVLGGVGAYYDTAGMIEQGRKVWISAVMPQYAEPVRGDKVHNYLLATNSHDRSESFWIYSTDVRTVCKNTRRQSMVDRAKGISIRHTGEIRFKIQAAQEAVGLATKEFSRFTELADAMTRIRVEPKAFVDAVLDSCLAVGAVSAEVATKGAQQVVDALPLSDAEKSHMLSRLERLITRRKKVVDDILHRYHSDTNTAPGMLWSAYQAVTEHANHAFSYRGSVSKKAETRFNSIIAGRADELNQAAFKQVEACLAV